MDGIDLTFARIAAEKSRKREAKLRQEQKQKRESFRKRMKYLLILRVLLCIPMVIFAGDMVWQYMKTPFETLEAIGVICCLLSIAWTVDDFIKFRKLRPDHKGKSTN